MTLPGEVLSLHKSTDPDTQVNVALQNSDHMDLHQTVNIA